MSETYDIIKNEKTATLLISVYESASIEEKARKSLNELTQLVETSFGDKAKFNEIYYLTQCRSSPEAATYIGKGKVKEASALCRNNNVSLVVVDYELSPSQIKNLEDNISKPQCEDDEYINVRVIDRTMLILDIFSKHAITSEGKLQIEIAQLKYTSPRLTGKGIDMSRQGGGITGGGSGGIGARGPGESKLETDRRYIKKRISALEEELHNMETDRAIKRKKREKSRIPLVAITGYTNVGKSTLLNYLTDAGILAENKLFATLDPTVRILSLPSGKEILLSDTVGFINNLPHKLIEAFKSTLEEAKFADIILIVVDLGDEESEMKTKVTEEILASLEVGDKPTIYVFNKCDNLDILPSENVLKEKNAVCISATTGFGVDKLLQLIDETLNSTLKRVKFLFPFENQSPVNIIRKTANIISIEYTDYGALIEADVDSKTYGQYEEFLVPTETLD